MIGDNVEFYVLGCSTNITNIRRLAEKDNGSWND